MYEQVEKSNENKSNDSAGICQRQIYLGARLLNASSLRRRQIADLVRARASNILDRVMGVYDVWIGDGVSQGRRFTDQSQLVDSLIEHVRRSGGALEPLVPSSSSSSSGGGGSGNVSSSSNSRPLRPIPPSTSGSGSSSVAPVRTGTRNVRRTGLSAVVPNGRLRGGRADNTGLRDVRWPSGERPRVGDLVYGVDSERSNLMRGAQSSNRSAFPNTHMEIGSGASRVPFYINPLNDALLTNSPEIARVQVPSRAGQQTLGRYRNFIDQYQIPQGHTGEGEDVLDHWKAQRDGGTETRRGKFSTLSKLGVNFVHREGRKIYFGLTTFSIQHALNTDSPYYGAVTSQELRHFYHNRQVLCPHSEPDRLRDNTVIFIERGSIVAPPWTQSRFQRVFQNYARDVAPVRARRGSLATQYPPIVEASMEATTTMGTTEVTTSGTTSGQEASGQSGSLGERATGGGSSSSRVGGEDVLPALVVVVNQDLAGLSYQNAAGMVWANNGATFSDEFLLFRDHLVASMTTLRNGGLSAGASDTIRDAILDAIADEGVDAQGVHPSVPVQQRIFNAVDPVHGRNLWALLRFFRAHGL